MLRELLVVGLAWLVPAEGIAGWATGSDGVQPVDDHASSTHQLSRRESFMASFLASSLLCGDCGYADKWMGAFLVDGADVFSSGRRWPRAASRGARLSLGDMARVGAAASAHAIGACEHATEECNECTTGCNASSLNSATGEGVARYTGFSRARTSGAAPAESMAETRCSDAVVCRDEISWSSASPRTNFTQGELVPQTSHGDNVRREIILDKITSLMVLVQGSLRCALASGTSDAVTPMLLLVALLLLLWPPTLRPVSLVPRPPSVPMTVSAFLTLLMPGAAAIAADQWSSPSVPPVLAGSVAAFVVATGVVTILVVTIRRSSAHAQLAHQRVVLSPPCSPPEPGEASTPDAHAESTDAQGRGIIGDAAGAAAGAAGAAAGAAASAGGDTPHRPRGGAPLRQGLLSVAAAGAAAGAVVGAGEAAAGAVVNSANWVTDAIVDSAIALLEDSSVSATGALAEHSYVSATGALVPDDLNGDGRIDAAEMKVMAALVNGGEAPQKMPLLWMMSLLHQLKTIVHPSTLIVVAGSCVGSAFMLYGFDADSEEDMEWRDDTNYAAGRVVATLAFFLSFLLTFRLNVCYARWWEGRCLWGQLIFAALHTAQQGTAWIRDAALARRFTHMLIVFAWACKSQLRGKSLSHEEGAQLVTRGLLEQAELDQITSQLGWQPYYCLDVLRAVTNEAWRREGGTRLSCEASRSSAFRSLEDLYVELAKAIGGSIRVKATGLPIVYDTFLYVVITVFFTAAPLAWAEGAEWFTPILCLVVFLVIRALMLLGNQLVDPFGTDRADHPLEKFCAVVEHQCKVVLERNEAADLKLLHLPPSGRSRPSLVQDIVEEPASPGIKRLPRRCSPVCP